MSANQPQSLGARGYGVIAALAAAVRLAALRPDLDPAPPEALLLGAEPGATLTLVRLLMVAAGSMAPAVAAAAAARMAGRTAGWSAGLLLALLPFALRHASWLGAPALLTVAGALLSWGVVSWKDGTRARAGAVLAAGTGLAAYGLDLAPLTNVAPAGIISPLGSGIRRVGSLLGPAPALLAIAGLAGAMAHKEAGARRVLLLTLGLLLAVLLREGPDPHALSLVLPGAVVLAADGIARLGRPGRALLAVALVWTGLTAAGAIGASRGAGPGAAASEWGLRNLPNVAAVLVEEPEFTLPEFDASGTKGFHIVHFPPPEADGDVAALFYHPEYAEGFPWMVLQDPPPGSDPRRVAHHRFFRSEWEEAARFGEGEYPRAAVTILKQPEEWQPDSATVAKLAEPIEALVSVRDTSLVFADWAVEAGGALRGSGNPRFASPFLELARKRSEGGADYWFETGLAHLLESRWDEAMSALLDALKIDPAHGAAHYNLGTLLEREGDRNGAESEYRAAVLYLDDPTPAHVRLGVLHARRGHMEDARAELAAVRRLDPGGQGEIFLTNVINEVEKSRSGDSADKAEKGGSGDS